MKFLAMLKNLDGTESDKLAAINLEHPEIIEIVHPLRGPANKIFVVVNYHNVQRLKDKFVLACGNALVVFNAHDTEYFQYTLMPPSQWAFSNSTLDI